LTCTLVHVGQAVFDGILDRDHVDLGPEDVTESGVDRRRLAAPGRAGDEEGSRGAEDDLLQLHLQLVREPDLGERGRGSGLFEQAHDHAFALDRRQHGDADVEQAPGTRRANGHSSVLRHAMLGDVEPREHLDPADHTGGVLPRDSFHLLEDPVDPEPHDQHIAMWHEVDVARTIVRSLQDDRVHELDRRCVGEPVRSLQIDDVVCVLLHAGHVLPQQGGAGLRLLAAGQPMELGVDVCDCPRLPGRSDTR
jgi:hypothetical protein